MGKNNYTMYNCGIITKGSKQIETSKAPKGWGNMWLYGERFCNHSHSDTSWQCTISQQICYYRRNKKDNKGPEPNQATSIPLFSESKAAKYKCLSDWLTSSRLKTKKVWLVVQKITELPFSLQNSPSCYVWVLARWGRGKRHNSYIAPQATNAAAAALYVTYRVYIS